MRIVTWNVNSIRARLDLVAGWLDLHQPEVVLLQETRCMQHEFPMFDLVGRGYDVVHHGNHHRNGVAILSRVGLDDVQCGFRTDFRCSDGDVGEARLVSATCAGIRVHSVYVPNGRQLDHPQYRFKLAWLDHLRRELADDLAAGLPTVVAGDFNVAPAPIDIYDPRRFVGQTHASEPERAALRAIVDLGLRDITRELHPEPGFFTWWNYQPQQYEQNKGLRIDLFLTSGDIADRIVDVVVAHDARRVSKPSDHAPVVLELRSDT